MGFLYLYHTRQTTSIFWAELRALSFKLVERYNHRRRSGWNSEGDAWRALKVGRCRVGWSMGKGVLSPANYSLVERRELPQRGPWQSPGRKRILAYFEGHRTLLFVPAYMTEIWGGQFALAYSYSWFWGTYPPYPSPWSTAFYALRPWLRLCTGHVVLRRILSYVGPKRHRDISLSVCVLLLYCCLLRCKLTSNTGIFRYVAWFP